MQPDRRLDMSHVKAIVTAKETIALEHGQFFCRTPRAWEIWQEVRSSESFDCAEESSGCGQ